MSLEQVDARWAAARAIATQLRNCIASDLQAAQRLIERLEETIRMLYGEAALKYRTGAMLRDEVASSTWMAIVQAHDEMKIELELARARMTSR